MSAPFLGTHEGEAAMLRALLREGLILRLFQNDVRPGRTATLRTFREASFPGYEPIDIPGDVWKYGPGLPVHASAPPQIFTRSAAGTSEDIYGWYLTTPDGAVICAARFPDPPWDLRREHDALKVIPFLEMPAGD
jgi:hypothetical protein